MKLGDLEFKAIDFQGVGMPLGTDLTPLAERANQLLAERLETALKMYIAEGFGHYDRWSANENDLDSCPSHTARLVCIEPCSTKP